MESAADRQKTQRIESVDYLRGIAALAVMWFHFTKGSPNFLPDGLLKASGTHAYSGVAAFFVISGFIIPYSLERQPYRIARDGVRFLIRRIVRLEPPYLVSVLLVAALLAPYPLIAWASNDPPYALLQVMALHPFFLVPWVGAEWLSPVYWTLAIEFQYYVAAVFFLPALFSSRRWVRTLFLCGSLILSMAVTDDRLFAPYLSVFGLGFVHFLRRRRGMPIGELAFWAITFSCATFWNVGAANAIVGALTLIGLSLPWPRLSSLTVLGKISYSLYLVHSLVGSWIIDIAETFPRTFAVTVPFLVLAIVLSLGFAYVFWYFVERPSIALAGKITLSHQPLGPRI